MGVITDSRFAFFGERVGVRGPNPGRTRFRSAKQPWCSARIPPSRQLFVERNSFRYSGTVNGNGARETGTTGSEKSIGLVFFASGFVMLGSSKLAFRRSGGQIQGFLEVIPMPQDHSSRTRVTLLGRLRPDPKEEMIGGRSAG